MAAWGADVLDAARWLAGPAGRRSRQMLLFLGGATLALALIAMAVGNWAEFILAAIALVLAVGLLLFRLDLAVAVLAASFFFNAYLNHGAGIITIDKGLGAVAVMAWGLDWAVNRRRVLGARQLWLIGAFLLWTGISIFAARSDKAALVTSLRYLTFATLFFLVIQTVRGDRRKADVLVSVAVAAAAVASFVGLVAFFGQHLPRASGPIQDPNDFGFLLSSTVPLAIYQLRWAASRWARATWAVALALILTCTLVTFSRSALVGLAVASVWAVVAGRLRLRWLVTVLACLGVVAGVVVLASPQLIQTALGQKSYVAQRNIDVRLGYYKVELREFERDPITGVGPGNFVYRYYQFAPSAGQSLPFPSNILTISGEEAYLVILAEQGAPGLAFFLGYLALSWSDLRRRFPGDKRTDQLQAALAAGFVVAAVGALFLAEQYYPPLWFLPAVAASLARGAQERTPRQRPAGASSPEARSLVPGGQR